MFHQTMQSSFACFLVVPQTKEPSRYRMKQTVKFPFIWDYCFRHVLPLDRHREEADRKPGGREEYDMQQRSLAGIELVTDATRRQAL